MTEVGRGGGVVPEPVKLKKPGQTPCGPSDKEEGGQGGRGQRSSESRVGKIRGHSSRGILSPAPSLPRPCLLRGKICSRFASSRKSSECNCTQLGSAQSIFSTPFLHHIFL